MKATSQFVSRINIDNQLVRVKLNHDINVYPQEYNGIDFFVYRDCWRHLWYAIESQSGNSIVTNCYTKKNCIKQAYEWIDGYEGLNIIIQRAVKRAIEGKMISQDEYKEV